MPRALVLSLLILGALVAAPAEASAQGFLEKLFGWGGSSSAPPPPPPPQMQLPPPAARPVYGSQSPLPNPWITRPEGEDGSRKGGTYRTLCVRMCDGYYWPINHSTTRARFHKDASACRASCGQEAQLFYHPTSGDQAEMVDITGKAYARLPNAFKYRKTLVEGCKCRPEPWAVSEIERHQTYAASEADEAAKKQIATKGPTEAKTTVAAKSADEGGSSDEATAAPTDVAAPATPPPAPVVAAVPRPRPVKTEARPRPHPAAPPPPPAVAAHQPSPGGYGWPFGAGAKGLKWPGDQ